MITDNAIFGNLGDVAAADTTTTAYADRPRPKQHNNDKATRSRCS